MSGESGDQTIRDPRDARIQKLEERMNDMVHAADLRELAEDWRWEHAQKAGQQGAVQVAEAFERCADDLEELIEGGYDD